MSCINATLEDIPRSTTHTARRNTIPGWNSETDFAREKSLFWHSLWTINGKPDVGVLADVMRYVRNHYYSLVRKLKKDRNSAIKLSLGVAQTSHVITGQRFGKLIMLKKHVKCNKWIVMLQ